MGIIRKDWFYNNLPMIIVTTDSAEADRDQGMKMGANANLSKPIHINERVKTVKELLKIQG